MPLIRDYPQVIQLLPTDAFVIDRIGVGTEYIEAGSFETGAPYEAAFEFLGGTPPIANELLGGKSFPVAVAFAVNFAGASFHVETPPAAPYVSAVYQISGGVSTAIGSMTIATNGVFTFAIAVAPTFAVGDSIKFGGNATPDTQLANFWWSLYGTLA